MKRILLAVLLSTALRASNTSCSTGGTPTGGCPGMDTGFSSNASAVAGGTLLSQANANQITSWLGLTDVLYTNIFSEAYAGQSTVNDFHLAADNQGQTVVVLQVTPQGSSTPVLIGGYDPVSWNAALNSYVMDPTDAGRTAFIYNLSTTTIQRQDLTSQNGNEGIYQTLNAPGYGPIFGGGWDIGIFSGETYVYNFSYGGTTSGTLNILGNAGATNMTVDEIEVYTVSNEAPEPSTFCLLGAGLGAALWLQRNRT